MEETFKKLLQEIVLGEDASLEKPRYWINQGYSFKNDGEKVYIEMSKDKTKELVFIEVDKTALLEGKIQPYHGDTKN